MGDPPMSHGQVARVTFLIPMRRASQTNRACTLALYRLLCGLPRPEERCYTDRVAEGETGGGSRVQGRRLLAENGLPESGEVVDKTSHV